jgi:hypothetical protein
MSVQANEEGALIFTAKIDLTDIDKGAAEINQKINETVQNAVKASEVQKNQIAAQVSEFQTINAELQKTIQTIEQLKSMKVERQNFILAETDVEKISKYNQEIQTLDVEIKKLESVAASQKASFASVGTTIDRSKQELQDYLNTLEQFNKEGINIPINKRAPDSPRQTPQGVSPLDSDSLRTITQAKQTFAEMDRETQLFVKELVELDLQLEKVRRAQKNLDEEFEKGSLTAKQYSASTEALVAQEKNIADSLSLISQRQKQYEKSLDNVVQKTVSAQTQLSKLKDQMVKNPESPLFKEWTKEAATLQNSIVKVNEELKRTAQIEALTNKTTRIEALKVNEQDVTKISKYNQQLISLREQISNLQNFETPIRNIEKTGKAAESAASKTNILGKSWSFLKQAAYLIPGVGIAGIMNLAAEAAIGLAKSLFQGASAFDVVKNRVIAYKNAVSDINREAIKNSAGTVSTLELLRDVITDTNKTQGTRVQAIKEYNSIADEANQIDLKQINNLNKINDIISTQIDLIEKRGLARAAETIVAERAETFLLAQESTEKKVRGKVQKEEEASAFFNKGVTITQDKPNKPRGLKVGDTIRVLNQKTGRLEEVVVTENTIEQFDREAKKVEADILKTVREGRIRQLVQDDPEVQKAKQDLDSAVAVFKNTIARGFVSTVTKDTKKLGGELSNLLNERKSLLDAILNLQRDAFQSGLTKEMSEVDKVRERYDVLIKDAKALNEELAKKGLKKLSIDIKDLEAAGKIHIDNTIQKQDAQEFIKVISKQKEAFDQFEKYKLSVGVDNAKLLVGEDVAAFDDYISFLQTKLQELGEDASIGAIIKRNELSKLLEQAKTDKAKFDADEQAKNLQEVLKLTNQYQFSRDQIEQKFSSMRTALEKAATNMTKEQYQERLDALNKAKQSELTTVENNAVRQGEIYKRLGQDVIRFTKQQLKEEVAALADILKNDKTLTPLMKEDIIKRIKELLGLFDSIDEGKKKIKEFVDQASKLKNSFDGLANAVTPFNEKIGQSIQLMSQLVGSTINVVKGLDAFKEASKVDPITGKADIVGQISAGTDIASAAISVVQTIFTAIKASRDAKKQAQKDIAEFQRTALAGELEITQEYRERARIQEVQNKATIQALKDQKKLLEDQKKTVAATYNDLLNKLQNESFISGQHTKKDGVSNPLFGAVGAIFGLGKKTAVENEFASLAGKTFEEIEKLYKQGRLTDNAKTLFEELNKIKQEGVDIDAILEENKRRAEELFTGTTSKNIADTIADGLRQGKRSVADFANDMEEMFRNAIISGFEAQVIEERMQDFFKSFSEASQSNGGLDKREIESLRNLYKTKVGEILSQFDQIQSVTGVNFSSNSATGNQNTLVGQYRTLSEDTGNLLAGQFGGLRLTAAQHMEISRKSLEAHLTIQNNTANAVVELQKIVKALTDSQTGFKKLKVEI